MHRKEIGTLLLGLLLTTAAEAESLKRFDLQRTNPFPLQNRGWNEEPEYARLPERAQKLVREEVWSLSRHTAGLAVHFRTDAAHIAVRYCVSGTKAMDHMPATGVSGLDLYAIDPENAPFYLSGDRNLSGDTLSYTYRDIRPGFSEFRLFLPLYNTVEWMEIAVAESADFQLLPPSGKRPIVLYGTSIAQGGCASRPALAWSNRLSLLLNRPVVNLGFSGNGRLEPELLDLICETDAAVIVLDCLPNLNGMDETELETLIEKSVKRIRARKPDTPILLVEHAGFSQGGAIPGYAELYRSANRASEKAYRKLQKTDSRLYYLSREKIGVPMDGTVDGIHLNDLGMERQATACAAILRKILKKTEGNRKP